MLTKVFLLLLPLVSMTVYCGHTESTGDVHDSGDGHQIHGHSIPAAVKSRHSLEIKKVEVESEPIKAAVIDVPASSLPITIRFRSASSALKLVSSHKPSPGDIQKTSSQDEPQKLYHEVQRPVIQEVREVIQPYRRIVQEVRPVQEDLQTIVAKGRRGGYGGGGQGGHGGSGRQSSHGMRHSSSGHASSAHISYSDNSLLNY